MPITITQLHVEVFQLVLFYRYFTWRHFQHVFWWWLSYRYNITCLYFITLLSKHYLDLLSNWTLSSWIAEPRELGLCTFYSRCTLVPVFCSLFPCSFDLSIWAPLPPKLLLHHPYQNGSNLGYFHGECMQEIAVRSLYLQMNIKLSLAKVVWIIIFCTANPFRSASQGNTVEIKIYRWLAVCCE